MLILFISVNSFAQFDDVLKKVSEKVTKVELIEEKNVNTYINVDFKRIPAVPATNGMQRIITSEGRWTE